MFYFYKGEKIALTDAKTGGTLPVLVTPRFVDRTGCTTVSSVRFCGRSRLISSKIVVDLSRAHLLLLQELSSKALVGWRYEEGSSLKLKAT
jgi:hypothetical protein